MFLSELLTHPVSPDNNLPVIDNGDAVRNSLCFFHIMGGKKDCCPLGPVEAFDVIPDKASRLRIETKGWFIEEENFGVVEKASSDFERFFFMPPENFT